MLAAATRRGLVARGAGARALPMLAIPVQRRAVAYIHTGRMVACSAAATDDVLASSVSIFISNLPWTVDNGSLSDHIGSVSGGVVRADVLMSRGPNGPRSRGMAIVDFESPEAARAAVEALDQTDVDGRTINVRVAEPRAERPPRERRERRDDGYGERRERRDDGYGERRERRDDFGERRERAPRKERDPARTVFVGNLPFSASWQDLKDMFSGAGHPVDFCDVRKTPDGRSRGFAIVEFSDAGGASEAIRELDGRDLDGRSISLRPYTNERPTYQE